MFESFVIGPIAGDRLGIVRQCIDCRAAAGSGARECSGFGPGCLSTPHRTDARTGHPATEDPEERR